jgi:preprotein translocase subunit SecG
LIPVFVPLAEISQYLFGPIIFLLSLFMILLILVQRGRGGGLVGALGGPGGQSAFGTKAGDLFTRITVVTAAVWIFLLGFTVWWYTERGIGSALSESGESTVATPLPVPPPSMGPSITPSTGSTSGPAPSDAITAPPSEPIMTPPSDAKGEIDEKDLPAKMEQDKPASSDAKSEAASDKPLPESDAKPAEEKTAEKPVVDSPTASADGPVVAPENPVEPTSPTEAGEKK